MRASVISEPVPAVRGDLDAAWRTVRAALSRPAGTPGPNEGLAAALAALGLRTLAAEAAGEPPESTPSDDRIDRAEFVERAAVVAAMLQSRTGVVCGTPDDLRRGIPTELFRSVDGARVWRDASGVVGGLAGGPSAIARMPALVPPEDKEPFPSSCVLVGADPPSLLDRLWRETRPRSNGYAPRVLVYDPRPLSAVIGLTDLSFMKGLAQVEDMVASERLVWLLGPQAQERLTAWLNAHLGEELPCTLHLSPGGPDQETARRAAALLEQAHVRQGQALREVLGSRGTAVPAAWPAQGPLRVQVFTSLYSTYVRFAAADLAEAFRSLGHEARVEQEPDGSTRLTSLAHARAIDAFRPHLVVNINYLRSHMNGVVPASTPVVTWVQDALPHFFSGQPGAVAGPCDFVAGFIYPELVERGAFPPSRTLGWANAVSPAKFHAGPTSADAPGRFACEIAMATRHSETPARFVERAAQGFGEGTPVARVARAVAAGVGPVIDAACLPWRYITPDLHRLTVDALREALGAEPPASGLAVMLHSFTKPLADLIFRQQTASWAAAIAARRGWRLHLYGRGWDEHPTLADFARPELTHDAELREAYQLARVHLHASVRGMIHQRVAEIAMSGGLPLCRRTFEDADRSRRYLLNAMHGRAAPDCFVATTRHPGYVVANHPGAMRVAAELGRLGYTLGYDGLIGNSPTEIAGIERTPPDQLMTPEKDPHHVLVDFAETTFGSEEELERRVEAALSDRWRGAISAAVARRCRERFGLDRFANSIIGMVGAALKG